MRIDSSDTALVPLPFCEATVTDTVAFLLLAIIELAGA